MHLGLSKQERRVRSHFRAFSRRLDRRSLGVDPGQGARFRAFWRGLDRRERLNRRKWWFSLPLAFLVAVTSGYIALHAFAPWPPLLMVKHILAAPNCTSARAVGL